MTFGVITLFNEARFKKEITSIYKAGQYIMVTCACWGLCVYNASVRFLPLLKFNSILKHSIRLNQMIDNLLINKRAQWEPTRDIEFSLKNK